MKSRPPVSIVGLGYVGLSTGVCLAHRGIPVVGIEIDHAKVTSISNGEVPFVERGLDSMLRSGLRTGRFRCTDDYTEAIGQTGLTFLTVGTPSRPDGSIDLAYLKGATETVGRELAKKRGFHHVVVKSTAIPGTTQGLVKKALEESSGKKCGEGFGLAANPEFLREGSAVADTLGPDAIVIGTLDKRTKTALISMYKAFYGKLPPVVSTTPANAELIKYAANTFRASQLSFLNTLANLCSGIGGADIDEVAAGFSKVTVADPRYLKAGLGFGGSCLPKDLRAIVAYCKQAGTSPALFEAALSVNEAQPMVAVRMTRELVGILDKKRIAVLGLAFKANTDDVRESVAMRLVERLLNEGARVTVYDPKAMGNARRDLQDRVSYAESARDCLKDAEGCIVATGWPEFARIRPHEFKRLMSQPAVVDGRRVLDARALRAGGVRCVTLGSGTTS
jgi:UDPglucose 6-dehydrogenase